MSVNSSCTIDDPPIIDKNIIAGANYTDTDMSKNISGSTNIHRQQSCTKGVEDTGVITHGESSTINTVECSTNSTGNKSNDRTIARTMFVPVGTEISKIYINSLHFLILTFAMLNSD